MLVDNIKLTIIAGRGGNGSPHLRRDGQTAKGGPDGGNGGNGGVFITGGAVFDHQHPDHYDKQMLQDRNQLIELIKNKGLQEQNITARWLPDQTAGNLKFDIKTGEGILAITEDNYRTLTSKEIKEWKTLNSGTSERCHQILVNELFTNPGR
jgi:GTP-binding protein